MARAFAWPGIGLLALWIAFSAPVPLAGQAAADPPAGQQPPQGTQQPPATGAPEQPPSTSGQRPSFRAGVDLVSLNVTVTDQSGRYITDLDSPDFQVFEDGAQQQVTFFNRANLPIALSILLDTSASMESKLE